MTRLFLGDGVLHQHENDQEDGQELHDQHHDEQRLHGGLGLVLFGPHGGTG